MNYPYQFLDAFREHNTRRARENFAHPTTIEWWTNAIAGEVGEACNISKKISRGDFNPVEQKEMEKKLAIELADAMTYIDLALDALGYKTSDVLLEKFNIVSERVGYPKIII